MTGPDPRIEDEAEPPEEAGPLEEVKIGKAKGAVAAKAIGGARQIGSLVFHEFGGVEVPIQVAKRYFAKDPTLSRYAEEAGHPIIETPGDLDAFRCACSQENIQIWNNPATGLPDAEMLELETAIEAKETGQRTQHSLYLSTPPPRESGQQNLYVLKRRIWFRNRKGEVEWIAPADPNVAALTFREAKRDESGRVLSEAGIEVIAIEPYTQLQGQIQRIIDAEYERQKLVYNAVRHKRAFHRIAAEAFGIRFAETMAVTFVPSEAEKVVRAYAAYLARVAARYRLTAHPIRLRVMRVFDEEEVVKALADDVAREVQTRFDKLLSDVADYLEGKQKMVKEAKDTDQAEAVLKSIDAHISSKLKQRGELIVLRDKYETLLGLKIAQVKSTVGAMPAVASARLLKSTERDLKKLSQPIRSETP